MREDREYQAFDFGQVKLVRPAILKTLQARHADAQAKVLDADVVTWLSHQDHATKQHVNDVIRHIMALKHA